MFVTQLARQHGRAFSSTLRSFTINGGGIQPLATKHQPSSSVCTPHPRNSLLTFSGEYHYTSAIALHEELGQRSGVASVTVNIGIVYQNLGEYGKSLEYFARAIALYEELGERSGVASDIPPKKSIGSYEGVACRRSNSAGVL